MTPRHEHDHHPSLPIRGSAPGDIELDLVIPALNEERRIGADPDRHRRRGRSRRCVAADPRGGQRMCRWHRRGGRPRRASPTSRWRSSAVEPGARVPRCGPGIQQAIGPLRRLLRRRPVHPPLGAPMGIDLLRSGWEVVIGSRRCTGAGYVVPQGNMRRLGSFAFRTMASDLSGPITDTQCGFKLFHTECGQGRSSPTSTPHRLRLRRRGPGPGPPAQAPDDRATHPVDRQPRVLVPTPGRRGQVVPRAPRGPSVRRVASRRRRRVEVRASKPHRRRLVVIANWRDRKHPEAGRRRTGLRALGPSASWRRGHDVVLLTVGGCRRAPKEKVATATGSFAGRSVHGLSLGAGVDAHAPEVHPRGDRLPERHSVLHPVGGEAGRLRC